MPSLTTLDGIDLTQFKSLLKDITLEYLKVLRKYKKHLPKDHVTVIDDSGQGTSYDKVWAVEWDYLSLAFHKQIEQLQKTENILSFVQENEELSRVLLNQPPEEPRHRHPLISHEDTRSELQIQQGNLHSRLIDPFLEHYISRARSLTFKQNIFYKTMATLERAIVNTTDQGVILCPISNLVIKTDKIQVSENILIRKLRKNEIERWISESGWSHPPLTFSELTRLQTGIEITFDKPRDY